MDIPVNIIFPESHLSIVDLFNVYTKGIFNSFEKPYIYTATNNKDSYKRKRIRVLINNIYYDKSIYRQLLESIANKANLCETYCYIYEDNEFYNLVDENKLYIAFRNDNGKYAIREAN